MSAGMRGSETNRIRITENDSDVTVTDAGGVSGTPQTIFDLEPPTDVEYHIHNGLRLILFLRDTAGDDIEDDSEIILVGQDQVAEPGDSEKIGRSYRYGEFSQANQRDEDEVVRLDLERRYEFTEASHLKIQLDSGTAVDWSESNIELEVIRKS